MNVLFDVIFFVFDALMMLFQLIGILGHVLLYGLFHPRDLLEQREAIRKVGIARRRRDS